MARAASTQKFICAIKALLFGLVIIPNISRAQFSLTPHFTLNRTALPNAGDSSSGPLTLDYQPTYRLAGGLDLGYRFETGFGLSGVSLGLDYTPVAQNYGFTYHTPALVSPARPTFSEEYTTSLKYLRGSVSAEFTLINSRNGFRLTLSPGFYAARLLSFHDGERGEGGWSEGTANRTFFLLPPIFDTALFVVQVIGQAYRKWDYGPQLAIGAEYPLSETAAITISLHGTYGIPNAEAEEAKLETVEPVINVPGGTLVFTGEAWYNREGRFMFLPAGISTGPVNRAPTHTFTLGASIGLRFTF